MVEVLEMIGSLFIILAFMFKDVRIIRILDSIGASLFIVYGIFIHSWSNIFLNIILILIQVYRLIEPKKKMRCFI